MSLLDRTFIALPVKGDAFLLRRNGRCFLIDGGENTSHLAASLNILTPEVRHIDVIVCTHADRDHANGLRGLAKKPGTAKGIDQWSGSVGEYWLPGRWVDVVPSLLEHTKTFVDGLVKELDRISKGDRDGLKPEEISDNPDLLEERVGLWFRERSGLPTASEDDHGGNADIPVRETWEKWTSPSADDGDWEPPIEAPWWVALRERMEIVLAKDSAARKAFNSGRSRILARMKRGKVPEALAALWLDLIETAENIRDIARDALELGVSVRWFDYREYKDTKSASGGVSGWLEPINSVESRRPPGVSIFRSYLLHLTRANRESLVFCAPERDCCRAVLFCADSPLGMNGRVSFFDHMSWKPTEPIIATVPHHGARSNDRAYDRVNRWAEVAFWVRSGGQAHHPDGIFRRIDKYRRVCTNCPHIGRPLKAVYIYCGNPARQFYEFMLGEIEWIRPSSGLSCTC